MDSIQDNESKSRIKGIGYKTLNIGWDKKEQETGDRTQAWRDSGQ